MASIFLRFDFGINMYKPHNASMIFFNCVFFLEKKYIIWWSELSIFLFYIIIRKSQLNPIRRRWVLDLDEMGFGYTLQKLQNGIVNGYDIFVIGENVIEMWSAWKRSDKFREIQNPIITICKFISLSIYIILCFLSKIRSMQVLIMSLDDYWQKCW